MKHPIPVAALDDRLAYVGTAGSGKTYNAGSGVELLLDRNARVVVADPLGVWWGLRLKPDGKTPSPYNVVIFGGPNGDIAINEHAGALIGETVAGMAESCIVDLSQIGTKAGERRFMLAFLTALYRKTGGEPMHLVIDEADMFAPQRLMDKDGDAARLLGMMETIVRRGRVKGFIPWLITQRPAVLSKDVLSQADGMVAFKLTASQDRAAIGAWIEGQADQQQGKQILASLPSMQRGQGVVWVPGRSILETASFPEKRTFDSSKTPRRGEKKSTASLKPLDLGKLKDRLSTIEAETKENDPKALKAEIATLKRELAAKPAAAAAPVDTKAIEAGAYARGLAEGMARGEGRAKKALEIAHSRLMDVTSAVALAFDGLDSPIPPPIRPVYALRPATATARQIAPRAAAAPIEGFSSAQNKVLRSMAMWRALGHHEPSREMVAAVAGYSPSSGGFNNLLGGLGTAGAIGKPRPGHVSLLMDGVEAIDRDQGRALLLSSLSNPQRKLTDALLENAGAVSRDDLGAATGYSPSSGGFNNLIGSLSTLDIICKPQPGFVELTDWAKEVLG